MMISGRSPDASFKFKRHKKYAIQAAQNGQEGMFLRNIEFYTASNKNVLKRQIRRHIEFHNCIRFSFIHSDLINFSLQSMHSTFISFVARNELPQHGHMYFLVLDGFFVLPSESFSCLQICISSSL